MNSLSVGLPFQQFTSNFFINVFETTRQTENKNSMVAIKRLTISEAVILAVITEVFRGRQEVFLYGRDGTIGVIIDPMGCCSALLKLSLLPPLETNKELVDIKDDAAGLGGASLP